MRLCPRISSTGFLTPLLCGLFLLGIISTRCLAEEPLWPLISLNQVASGFSSPVDIQNAGDGSGRLFIVEQGGRIRIVKNGTVNTSPFLDISSRVLSRDEQGLLGLAFPPGFVSKSHFYVCYVRASDRAVTVSRFRVTADRDLADPQSEEVLLAVPKPYDNHNGGQIAFGPDGLLYISIGDGGGAGDPLDNAQNLTSRLGKILRIDVENAPSGKAYGIPASNPFAAHATYAPEILFWGLRNPWRFSIDPETGDLSIGDVGEVSREEINLVPGKNVNSGGNFGWPLKEGTKEFRNPGGISEGLIAPIFEYGRDYGSSVVGGRMYRGMDARLRGFYIFANFGDQALWMMASQEGQIYAKQLQSAQMRISSFGADEAGELYVTDYYGGNICRIESRDRLPPPQILPAAGTYTDGVSVGHWGAWHASVVHYTTDGTTPDSSSPVLKAGESIRITEPATVKAIAIRRDLLPSPVVEVAYQLQPGAVQFAGGMIPSSGYASIQLSVSTLNAEIRYTTDGSSPGPDSKLYEPGKPIYLDRTTTIKAVAFRGGWQPGPVSTRTFAVKVTEPALFSPWAGLYEPVHLVSNTPGATIHYTLDGSNPTASSPVWSGPQELPAGTIIRARAVKEPMDPSTIQILEVKRVLSQRAIVATASTGSVSAYDVVYTGDGSLYAAGGRGIWKIADGVPTQIHTGGFSQDFRAIARMGDSHLAVADIGVRGIVTFLLSPYTESSRIGVGYTIPNDLLQDSDGSFLAVDSQWNRIHRVTSSGVVTIVAGTGEKGSRDGAAAQAMFNNPTGIARGERGELYIAERGGRRIRKLETDGTVSTYAGTGEIGWRDGPAAQAQFQYPTGIAVDRIGNVYVSDWLVSNGCIRKIRPDGIVTTLQGPVFWTDGVTLRYSEYLENLGPRGMDIAPDGTLYFADGRTYWIYKLTQDDWDNDGVPDETERSLGAPFVVGVDDRSADSDGDTYSNVAEWISGTSSLGSGQTPQGPASRKVDNDTLLVSVPAEVGRKYQLEYSEDLTTWKPMGSAFVAQSSAFTAEDKISSVIPRRFYRLKLVP